MLVLSLFRQFTIIGLALISLLPALTEMAFGSSVYTHAHRISPSEYPVWTLNAIWTDSGLVVANRAGTGAIAKSIIKLPPSEAPVTVELCVAGSLNKNDTDQLSNNGISLDKTVFSLYGSSHQLLNIKPDLQKAINLNLDLEVISHCTSVIIDGTRYSHSHSVKTGEDIPPILSTGKSFQVSLKVAEEEQSGAFSGMPGDQHSDGLPGMESFWDNDPFKLDKPGYPGWLSDPKQQTFDLMLAYLQRAFSIELIGQWLQQWFQDALQQVDTPEEALIKQDEYLDDLFLLVFNAETGNYQIYNQRLPDGQNPQHRLGFYISEQGMVTPYIEVHQTGEEDGERVTSILHLPLRLVRTDPVTGDYIEVTEREIGPGERQDTDDILPVSYIKTLIEQEALFWQADFIRLLFSADLKELAQRLQVSMNGHFSFLPEATASNISDYLSHLFISLIIPGNRPQASSHDSVRRQLGRMLHKQLHPDKTRLLIGHQGFEFLKAIGNRISKGARLKPENLTVLMTVLFSDQITYVAGAKFGQGQQAVPTNAGFLRQVPTGQSDDQGNNKVKGQSVAATSVVTSHPFSKTVKTRDGNRDDQEGNGEDPSHSGTCEKCHQRPVSDGRNLCRDCATKTVPDSFSTTAPDQSIKITVQEASKPEEIPKVDVSGQMTLRVNLFAEVSTDQVSRSQKDSGSSISAASLLIPKSARRAARYRDVETSLQGMLGLTLEGEIHLGKEREVWKYRNNNNHQFAVKVFRKKRNSSLNEGEPNALQIDHPNIAKVHAMVFEKKGDYVVADHIYQISLLKERGYLPLAVISDFVPGSRLNDYKFVELTNFHDGPVVALAELTLKLCRALEYLHKKQALMHRDLKPENIIYNPNDGTVKIIDFGTSIEISPKFPSSPTGTKKYYAPEMFCTKARGGHDYTVDIWGIGTVLMDSLTGMTPNNYNRCYTETPKLEWDAEYLWNSAFDRVKVFSARSPEHRVTMLEQHLRPPFNRGNVPKELLDLTANLLALPGQRPTWDTIIEQLSGIKEQLVRKRCIGLSSDSFKSQVPK